MNLSIHMITYNAMPHLKKCIASLPRQAEWVVVDSFSTDETVPFLNELKDKGYNLHVFQQEFVDFSTQRNFALEQATKDWILWVDADEVLEKDCLLKIGQIMEDPGSKGRAFQLKRRLVFSNQILYFGKSTDYPLRLFPRQGAVFKGRVHESVQLPHQQIDKLSSGLLHFSYDHLEDCVTKLNRYSSIKASEDLRQKKKPNALFSVLKACFHFGDRYFLRLGFLDGEKGFQFAFLHAWYHYLKYAKLREQFESHPSAFQSME